MDLDGDGVVPDAAADFVSTDPVSADPVSTAPTEPASPVDGSAPVAAGWALPGSADVAGEAPVPSGRSAAFRRLAGRRLVTGVAVVAVGAAGGALVSHAAWPAGQAASAASSSTNGGTGLVPGGIGGYAGSAPGFNGGAPGGTLPGGDPFGGEGAYGGSSSGSSGAGNSNASDGPTDAAAIARRAEAGLVDITTTLSDGTAAGTGMVLTSTGEVLTNNHVITGATSISVRDVGDGKTYKATVVGYDRSEDVAVLQLSQASGLTTVSTAASEPSSGASVVGVGNAGGTGGTPSYAGGAIVKTGASITASNDYDGTSEKLTGLLVTDADIQAGDSGGPLLNTDGQVVGMDTAASEGSNGFSFQGSEASATRGFAIPITTALSLAHEIWSGDESSTIHLGPTAALGVYVGSQQGGSGGVTIAGTVPGGPAAKAGLAEGDALTSVAGTAVSSPEALVNELSRLRPGATVDVTYETYDGASKAVAVTLTTGPAE